jgi:hypothetical protein
MRRYALGNRVRARIERRADDLGGELRTALIVLTADLEKVVPPIEIERRIRLGLEPYTDAEIERALARFRLRLRDGVEQAGASFTERKA